MRTFNTNNSLDFCFATIPNQKFNIGFPNQKRIVNNIKTFIKINPEIVYKS